MTLEKIEQNAKTIIESAYAYDREKRKKKKKEIEQTILKISSEIDFLLKEERKNVR